MHGGLSPALTKVEDVNSINRQVDVPHDGPMCDTLWSDPDDTKLGWGVSPRGAGWTWGPDITEKFLHTNKLMNLNLD